MDSTVDTQITDCFKSGRQNVQDLIAPLIELASQSSSLVVGYGTPQAGVRSEMIPYFHVCGTPADKEPIRVLVIGGWVGTEIITPYAIARLLVALESRLRLATGIEITAYPVANLEAHRETVFLTSKQQSDGTLRLRRDFPFAPEPACARRRCGSLARRGRAKSLTRRRPEALRYDESPFPVEGESGSPNL